MIKPCRVDEAYWKASASFTEPIEILQNPVSDSRSRALGEDGRRHIAGCQRFASHRDFTRIG
jgi:hypothetical protein